MSIGICNLLIYLPGCYSLKNKRSILKGLIYKLRKIHNISISEIDQKDVWKNSTIAFCCISDNRKIIDTTINKVIKEIEDNPEIELINYNVTTI